MPTDHVARRDVLAALGSTVVAPTAGCVGSSGPTTAEMGESGPASDLTVANPRLQWNAVYSGAERDLALAAPGAQFLVVEVRAAGYGPKVSFFDVVRDDAHLDVDEVALSGDPEHANGRVAFPVPVAPAESASVVYEERGRSPTRWRVPPDVVAQFDATPEFEVESMSVTAGGVVEARVRNRGDRDGTFRATVAVDAEAPTRRLAVAVPMDATRTATAPLPDRGGDSTSVRVDWGFDAVERPVPDDG